MILEEFQFKLHEPGLLETYDDLQRRRAFFLTDIGSFQHAIPILEEIEIRQNHNPVFLFYLGHCFLMAKELTKAREKLERAISLDPPSPIYFQSHGSLGMALYELGEYARAKQELERSAEAATARYIKEAKIWKWLQNTCISLGLKDEAEHYRRLLEPC
jgi:tetratricopeptide (TPR) repeat protein